MTVSCSPPPPPPPSPHLSQPAPDSRANSEKVFRSRPLAPVLSSCGTDLLPYHIDLSSVFRHDIIWRKEWRGR